MAETNAGSSVLKYRIVHYEYEIIIFIFLLLRFIFKNILHYREYFTQEVVWGQSDKERIIIGTAVLLTVCILLASLFGRLIRANGEIYEKPVLYLVVLFFACPVTLPFLFKTYYISGTQMLYPFALFIFSVFLISTPVFKWLVPLLCAVFFVPAVHTSEGFFTDLHKGTLLYVPLILLFLYLDMMKKHIESGKNQKNQTAIKSKILFISSSVVSAGSYIYTLVRGKLYNEIFYGSAQKLNWYFFICILLAAPALCGVCVVLYKTLKKNYPANVSKVFIIAPFLLLPLYRNNYYGLWIPFWVLSLFIIVFYSIWQKNTAMLKAALDLGDYLSEHLFLFYIVLIAMACFSNVSSDYLSVITQNIFSNIPY